MAVLVSFPLVRLHYGKQLVFSRKPGYYDSAFYLTILGGGKNTIHYTLDGSEPNMDDPVVDRKNPIYIEDATSRPNVYSLRTDTSTGFLTDLIDQYVPWDPASYTVPEYPVDKCTVIRASLFDDNGNCLDSVTGSYFVEFQEKEEYENIYTVSLVTSPENLFDHDTGIYVTGNIFEQFLTDSRDKETWAWCTWDANYFRRGHKWERAAHITLFDSRHRIVLDQNCGIRAKGAGSSGLLPRSFSCYAREEYNGSDYFDADIFQTDISSHKIVIFGGGQDNVFKAKDWLIHTLTQKLPFATMDFIPCALFLDGEYWGMYYISEDYDTEYINAHYQVAKDNIIMAKRGHAADILAEGAEEDHQIYDEMFDFLCNNDMKNKSCYRRACELIDMDSYIDYYATEIYIANTDWPHKNFALWRARENDGSRYGDTKWRWMLFDVNYGMPSGVANNLAYVLDVDAAFASLYQNENFRRQFARRLLTIGKEVFAPEKCNQLLDQYAQIMKRPLMASNKRFYMDEKSDEFDQYILDIKTFFEKRYDVVWNYLVQSMGEEWLSDNGIQK